MQTVTAFSASAVSHDELGGILADYLALDRARIFRRLLVNRCGLVALIAALAGVLIPQAPQLATWCTVALFLALPLWAWIVEIRLEWRLARRLEEVDGAVTHDLL